MIAAAGWAWRIHVAVAIFFAFLQYDEFQHAHECGIVLKTGAFCKFSLAMVIPSALRRI